MPVAVMEVFIAKFDYEKEREDLLSFKEGEKFRIASKADKKWWSAYSVLTGDYGYVPSSYMEVSYIAASPVCIATNCSTTSFILLRMSIEPYVFSRTIQ